MLSDESQQQRAHVQSPPNPFLFDFHSCLRSVCWQCILSRAIDGRAASYLCLLLYRMLRSLIPDNDDMTNLFEWERQQCDEEALTRDAADGQPPVEQPSGPLAVVSLMSRLYVQGQLRNVMHVELEKRLLSSAPQRSLKAPFTRQHVQQLLSIDAQTDRPHLSQRQQWLISSEAWQSGAATLCEHFLAEVMEAIGTREEKSDAAWLKRNAVIDIECIYEAVSDDEELFSFWQFVGMKAHCPPEAYIPALPSYQQQPQAAHPRRRCDLRSVVDGPGYSRVARGRLAGRTTGLRRRSVLPALPHSSDRSSRHAPGLQTRRIGRRHVRRRCSPLFNRSYI